MKTLNELLVNPNVDPVEYNSGRTEIDGLFRLGTLRIIASAAEGWDHVSVSREDRRLPTWTDMENVKRAFFRDCEMAIQIHSPIAQHFDMSGQTGIEVLHLWRPHAVEIPLPPREFL